MADTSRAALIARQQQLQAAYPTVNRDLLKIPGVVRVGIGVKEVEGASTGELVFRVYVLEKKAPGAIPASEAIPKEIQGYKTDVVVVLPEHPEDEDTSKYRPVKCGVQIEADGIGGYGTLGCLAHLVSDNSVVLLSNHHVLYGSAGTDGTEVGQPTYDSSCCCTCNDIAVNVHGIHHDHLDCAIARLKPDYQSQNTGRIQDIGFITGVAAAVASEAVKKRGRTTRLTTGNVANLRMDATGTKILEIEVKKNNGQDRFSRPGDSGSALLNNNNEIIGLHKAGNNGDTVTAGNFTSTSIGFQEVLDAMNGAGFQITIITGAGGDELTDLLEMRRLGLSDALWALELRLQESEPGTELWEAVRRHQREILRLVNEDRAVTVVWHRSKGPTFLAALGRSAKEPAYAIPDEIEGVGREEAAMRIFAALQAHGSASLLADLNAFGRPFLQAIKTGTTAEEIVTEFENVMAAEMA